MQKDILQKYMLFKILTLIVWSGWICLKICCCFDGWTEKWSGAALHSTKWRDSFRENRNEAGILTKGALSLISSLVERAPPLIDSLHAICLSNLLIQCVFAFPFYFIVLIFAWVVCLGMNWGIHYRVDLDASWNLHPQLCPLTGMKRHSFRSLKGSRHLNFRP